MTRFEIEECGQHPSKLAHEVHRQLGQWDDGAIPVVDIAYALDICDIRKEPLENFEGSVVMPPNKSVGSILVNSNSSISRQRFTIAHELCHLLHGKHKPLSVAGHSDVGTFQCRKQDMRVRGNAARTTLSPYLRQEQQANQFAADILMPKYKLRACLREQPNLEHILSIASDLKVSKETAAQRYVATHDDTIAIVFSKDRTVRYWAKPKSFPRVRVWNGRTLDDLGRPIGNTGLTNIDEAAVEDWLADKTSGSLQVQTLFQLSGYAMTLLHLEDVDEDEDDGLEDSYERFSRDS